MRSVQLVKYDFLSSLFVCNKINIIWCWWWYTRTMTCYDDHTFLSHCSIFGYFYTFATVQSNQRAVLWSECVCMAVALLSQANRRTSGHMQQLSCILRFDVLCMLSFFALQWINYMFNTSINICIWSSLHADSLSLSIYLFLDCMFAQFFFHSTWKFCFSAFYCSNSV